MKRHIRIFVVAAFVLLDGGLQFTQALPAFALTTYYNYDLHDGKSFYAGAGNQEFVGTQYNTAFADRTGCKFTWLSATNSDNTPSRFCGFAAVIGASRSRLFDPNSTNTYRGVSWQATCASNNGAYTAYGCFNPRVLQRTWDGRWLLWFNAPREYQVNGTNAYYMTGCDGPTGPCGPNDAAGDPWHKATMSICTGNGDFDIVASSRTDAYIVCTMANQTLSIEKLDGWWANGTGTGQSNMAALKSVEAPSIFGTLVQGTMKYYLTYSQPYVGYADPPNWNNGDGTGYATASSLLGTWSQAAYQALSQQTCQGQPRTLAFDGSGNVFEWIDNWQPGLGHSQGAAAFSTEGITVNPDGSLAHMADCA